MRLELDFDLTNMPALLASHGGDINLDLEADEKLDFD
jgi:hypothetical protein